MRWTLLLATPFLLNTKKPGGYCIQCGFSFVFSPHFLNDSGQFSVTKFFSPYQHSLITLHDKMLLLAWIGFWHRITSRSFYTWILQSQSELANPDFMNLM